MDKEEFLKDEALVTRLSPIGNLATQLASDISDTMMLAGSEALAAALFYYGTTKQAADRGIATADPIYDDLKQRFVQRSRRNPPKTE